MIHKMLTDAQARAYIEGVPPFNPKKYEIEHVEYLCKSVSAWLSENQITAQKIYNLTRTVERYIQNHLSAPNRCKLDALLTQIKSMQFEG